MSEDKDLLARIGHLAGHINLHKTQTSPGPQTASAYLNTRPPQLDSIYPYPYSRNLRSNRSGSSQGRAGRVARTGSRNYSLVLNNSASQRQHTQDNKYAPSLGSNENSQSQSEYISKHGRHKQLINSSIFGKESQKRIKALETTRQRKASARNQWEHEQMQRYIRKLDVDSNRSQVYTLTASGQKIHQIEIDGLHYSVLNNGSKLARILGPLDKAQSTPKRATLHGVMFLRSKNGNLYRSGAVRPEKLWMGQLIFSRATDKIKKISQPCKHFSKSGHCARGPRCPYLHDPSTVAICPTYLQLGSCPAESSCDLSHNPTPERVPACLHFLRGKCSNPSCRYAHIRVSPSAAICRDFAILGYCGRGADCTDRHAHECPDYANSGICHIKNCGLPHIDRAGQIRKHAADLTDPIFQPQDKGSDEAYESDISSEEANDDEIDSEDIDSDECNEPPMENADDVELHPLSQQDDFVGL